jgi:DNA replication protein DnaC
MTSMTTKQVNERLVELCGTFKLPTVASEVVPRFQKAGQQEVLPLLLEVLEQEAQDRLERRIERLRRASHLPPGKTFDTLNQTRLCRPLVDQLRALRCGEFLQRAGNVLCFGLPGAGKTHAAAALGHALVDQGHAVLFASTYKLVQELLKAKKDLALPRALRKLDLFELIILDDIGYIAQSPEEAEVLFTLLAERYERHSVLITSNLVFSQWERIFKNPMTTAAAIDRLVHHSVILEFDVPSYRTEDAQRRRAATAGSGNYPAGGDNYPAGGDNYPARGDNGSADGDSSSASGDNYPAGSGNYLTTSSSANEG